MYRWTGGGREASASILRPAGPGRPAFAAFYARQAQACSPLDAPPWPRPILSGKYRCLQAPGPCPMYSPLAAPTSPVMLLTVVIPRLPCSGSSSAGKLLRSSPSRSLAHASFEVDVQCLSGGGGGG